ncbi:MAG TPA: HAMP domain-containing sensor histidine kinase [Bacteroidales bacterium]|nr:HAMP domain-containing sensor histidine kinase [Bacteroidales bacterium]
MSRVLNKIGLFLVGNQKELPIENLIFNILTFFAAFACFLSIIANIFVGFPLEFNIALVLYGVIFGLFFYLSSYKKITKYLEIYFQIICISALSMIWYYSQGVEGAGTFYFFLGTFAFIYSNSKKKYWLIFGIYLSLAIAYVLIGLKYPDFVLKYASQETRILDLSTSMIISLVIFGVIAVLLKQNYDKERLKVEQHAEKLKSLNATKDKFFSIISHDLKNPFNNLLGLSRQLLADYENFSSSEILIRLKMIEESSKRGYNLLENLLEWSMTQKGTIQFEPSELNLHDVIQECLLVIESQMSEKKINLIEDVDKRMVVKADYNMLKIIIRNLLTNAIKYSHSDGKIFIRSEINKHNEVEISITDEGVGIPEEDMSKLFKIEVKYSTPGTSNEFGTGLGLILCKEFVEKHNGRIWVISKLNSGSTFKFTLPK